MDELEKVIKEEMYRYSSGSYSKRPIEEVIAQAVREWMADGEAVCVRCFKPYHRVCPPCHDAILQMRRQQGE